MFRSKKLRKMTAKLTAVMMCAALIGTTAPITATENDTVLLNADFEPTSESVLAKDFEDGNCATVTFENGQRPLAELKTDENDNNYAIIDAGKYPDGEGWISGWVNGGYLFDDGKKIENGNWTISFDFNVESGGSYANVSLAKSNVKGEEYGQFRLLGTDGTNVLVNKTALDNNPVHNHW